MKQPFEELYQEQYQRLYTLAFRLSGNRSDAEDILQTSFMNAFNAYEKFEGRSSVSTWLYQIVLNASRQFWRDARKLPVTVIAEENGISEENVYSEINSYGETENEILTEQLRESCIQMFMNCMPPKYRVVYTLRVILDFSVEETMAILECSKASVKTDLSRAKSIMRDHFDGRCSLITPGSKCNCRSYAKYLERTKSTDKLLDLKVVRQEERIATEQFKEELQEILGFDSLFMSYAIPIEYAQFQKRITQIRKNGELNLICN